MSNHVKPLIVHPERHPKGWGEEVWIANEEYCCKLLRFDKGAKFSMHYHVEKKETFYVLSGRIMLEWFNTETADRHKLELLSGEAIQIPRNLPHKVIALEPTVIIEASTHHEDSDSYRDQGGGQAHCSRLGNGVSHSRHNS